MKARASYCDQLTDDSVLEIFEVMHMVNTSARAKLRDCFDFIQQSKFEMNV
jgi:hypothetical protein